MIDYEHLMSLRTRGERVSYADRDTLLYALGAGLGRDPADTPELAYVTEHRGLKTLPTFASILAPNNLLDDCGWDAGRVVPHEESVVLHRPIEESGTLLIDSEIAVVFDKGADVGALVVVESRARRERDGQPAFTVRRTWLARGDGGFGGPRGGSTVRHSVPERRPDMTEVLEEAWELVEKKGMAEEDFHAFSFGNAVRLWASLNPDFFKGTTVEKPAREFAREASASQSAAAS